jgi:AP-4 complex subunit epsilon-1
MDVPFISSGAMSRAHYALVRKVESANSPQLADRYLLSEIQSLRRGFEDPRLSLVRSLLCGYRVQAANVKLQKQCKEYLIILMYCSMAITSGLLSNGQFDFALPHAVSLAEAGHTVQDKRIGEQFIVWFGYVTDSFMKAILFAHS